MGLFVLQWMSVIDERTCDCCRDLDGQLFLAGTEPPCPLHPKCRCSIIVSDITPEEFLATLRRRRYGG